MEVIEVLCMNGGIGEMSYANNSLVQKKVISMTKPITEQAITELYRTAFPKTLCIADLGCSSGPNTLLVVSGLVKTVEKVRRELGRPSLEYQICLNDLPGNDFNTIFKSLPSFQDKTRRTLGSAFGPCLVSAVPGSFYGRLFPANTIHFVHASYSLQWLSEVPKGIENNKGNIYMASTSPPSVIKAYYQQFQRDFSVFLKCRSEEVVAGGRMVLTILGRKSEDRSSKEGCLIWELLAMALKDMVAEGLIEEEKLDTFNIPQYTPSPAEVKSEVEKEGSFVIDRLEATAVDWSASENGAMMLQSSSSSSSDGLMEGYSVAKCMRAVAEPLLLSHFDPSIMDEVFRRYTNIIADRMSKEKTQFINVVVSMTRME